MRFAFGTARGIHHLPAAQQPFHHAHVVAHCACAGGALTQQWNQQFHAPTAAEAAQTPGYQFALGQGLQALDRGAAARGNLLTGGTMEAEQQYGQGLASQTYQQTFNNALTQYQQAYNQFQQGQANTYNRLAGLAGTGQVSAGQLGQEGGQAANSVANTILTGNQQIGQQMNNAAAANASGYVGSANAWNSAISGIGNSLSNYAIMQQLLNSKGGGGTESLYDPNVFGG